MFYILDLVLMMAINKIYVPFRCVIAFTETCFKDTESEYMRNLKQKLTNSMIWKIFQINKIKEI